MRLRVQLISLLLLALFSATFAADILPNSDDAHSDERVASDTASVQIASFSNVDSADHKGTNDCGDPCHLGTCHFGHCAHMSSVSAHENSPNHLLAQHRFRDVVAPNSPYLTNLQRPPRLILA